MTPSARALRGEARYFSYAMIRRLTTDDTDALAAVEATLFENSMSPAQLAHEINAGYGCAIGGPEIHAYALLRFSRDVVDLTRLGVAPDFQRQGLGRRLLQHILAEHPHVILTVKKDNTPALRLYRAHGFCVIGHFNEDRAWLLARRPAEASSSRPCPLP